MEESEEVLTRGGPEPAATLSYGPLPDQVVDLWLPGTPSPPLVVLVHGGFWKAAYDRAHLRPMAGGLVAAGYAVAVPEYRRAGQPGGGWPGTFDDVAAVFDALPALVEGHGVDTGASVWAGHSAGGHLALWASLRSRLPEGSPWRSEKEPWARRIVSLAGCADLALVHRLKLGGGAAGALMGGGPEEWPQRWAQADPAVLVPVGVPTVQVFGAADEIVPPEVGHAFAAHAAGSGTAAPVVEVPGSGHYGLIDPLSSAWPEVLRALAAG
ncbi:alpha/beta hydrolase [Actinocorallia longicatena]|uniref:Alpha/beta hydrolase n=1 Tax=Actinocorallia longicatena TaxID=111803 RepID=A0ABP6QEL8_9ACTN